MAKKIDNQKGFLIVEMTPEEAFSVGMGYQCKESRELICDDCNDDITNDEIVFYIAVLNRLFCSKCYLNWYNNAKYYPEDKEYEIKYYNYYAEKLHI